MIEEKELRDDLGQRIRKARLSQGYTQAQLAELAGLSPKYITLIETNNVNVSLGALIDIANALGESMEYFFAENNSEDIKKLPLKERVAVEELIRNLLE